MNKLKIFYKPKTDLRDVVPSFTLSYSEFDFKTGTCKEKLILEQNGEKQKIKNYVNKAAEIESIAKNIDPSLFIQEEYDINEALYCVKYNDDAVFMNDRSKIASLLDSLHFDELCNQTIAKFA